jgi:hypothetical protein
VSGEEGPARFAVLRALPSGYSLVARLEIDSRRRLIMLNVYGLILLVVALVAVSLYAEWLVRRGVVGAFNPLAGASPLALTALSVVGFVLMLTIHELIHGLAFQAFGARPRYGLNLRAGVAYASAKAYYVSRDAYIVVGLAPLVAMTLIGGLLIALTGGETRALLGLFVAANVGGAVGDLWFVRTCLRFPPTLLVNDFGDGATLYAPV